MIQFRDVSLCYNPSARRPSNALESVTLDVQAGEWVFFVGPSGAGKSTLLKLAYAGVLATRGRVFVDGQDVTNPSPQEIPLLRRKVGVVFQDFQLLSQKTVWENVAFALQVIGAPQKRLVRDVPRALETVGLESKGQAKPHELSGGEQQRVAIARAIVNDPKILVADEPTGNLDPRTADDIAEVLARINERGTTILMATHDRPLVDRLKKRVVRIANHRVVSDEAVGYYHPEDDLAPVFSQHFASADEDDALALAATLEDEEDTLRNVPRVLAPSQTPVSPITFSQIPPAQSPADSFQTASAPPQNAASQNGATQNVVQPNGAPQFATAQSVVGRNAISPGAISQDAASFRAAATFDDELRDAAETANKAFDETCVTSPIRNGAPHEESAPRAHEDSQLLQDPVSRNGDKNLPPHAAPTGVVSLRFSPTHPNDNSLLVRGARDNAAPIGSPENPIVQLDGNISAPPL